MKIERMTFAHIDDVCKIEKMCFSHPLSKEDLIEQLKNSTNVFFAATENNSALGYIGMSVVIDEGYFYNLAVDENYRQQGVGTALINALTEYGKANNFRLISLEVRESNQKAISLYSKSGFVNVGVRKNYYSAPKENAVLMTKYF